MIARPKISRNEWKMAERGAFEVGNFALLSCPGPADPTAVRQLARLADALDGARDADADAAAERAGGRDAKAAAATVYARAAAPFFPATAASSVCLLGTLFPRMPVHAELARAYPHGLLFAPSSADRRLVDAAYQALGLKQTRLDARGLPVLDGLDGDALYRFATSASLDAGDGERRVVLRFETPSNSAEPPAMTQHGVFGGRDAPRKFAVDLTVKQQVVLSAMLRDHCAGIDVCLCGWRGVGKTALARCFADALGYRVRTIFCYKDMGARDFLQRRVTDDRGNTGWKDSALVDAALRGDVAVLDGLLHGGLSETDLRARGLRRVSPSFRVVAIAGSVPSGTRDDRRGQWLDPELASLFHFHVAPVFEPNDERKLMKRELGPAPDGDVVVDVLLSYNKSIRDHAYQRDKLAMEKKVAAPATSLALCALSLRQLLRAARTAALDHDPDDCIDKAVGAYAKYLDPADRDAVQRYANTACRQAGLPCVEGSVAINGARSAPGKDRQLALLAKRAGRAAPAPDYASAAASSTSCSATCEREYVQLHRDTTVGSLTSAPVLSDGVVSRGDSPLVRALRHGRCLVVDEADKAPLEVVCILKALVEDGDLQLADGRRSLGGHAAEADDDTLWIDDAFRMIVLANRPGRPFQGNDFYRECGDAFASFGVDNPEVRSEVAMLKAYAPAVPDALVTKLSTTFGKLRDLAESPQAWEQRDEARLAYPYSARELVKVCEHLNAFADDGVDAALADVFAFDAHVPPLKVTLDNALKQDGFVIPMPKTWIAALRWMMQKLALKHDMFLIGDPGPRPRALVLQFCELLGRECEFVALTRDTSEGDLKQRREIRDGALVWANQPPVLAALHGRVLVLSGVERAERNVLPLLNNLLENREMALDDGTFLMDAKRFDALCAEDAERASGLVPDWRADQVMREQPTAARPWAPDGAVESTAALLAAFPRLPPGAALKRAYCYDLLESLKLDADGRAELDAWLDDAGFDVVEAEDPRGSTPFGPTPRLAGKVAAPAGERVPREASKPKKAGAEAPEFAAPRTDGAPAAEPAPNVARAALARRLRGDSDSDSDSS
ncbi:ATPase [Aureococcus anophagefferens]|nr:ATPase [Aureococcus anophagefferens]